MYFLKNIIAFFLLIENIILGLVSNELSKVKFIK